MSDDFILHLAHMARSRPPVRAQRRFSSAVSERRLRARCRAARPIEMDEMDEEEEDGGDDLVNHKVDKWERMEQDQTNEDTIATTEEPDAIAAPQVDNSCVELHDQPCHRHIFPFMSLPTEIRLQIYRLALARDTPVLLHVAKPKVVKKEETPEEEDLMHITRGSVQRARGMRVFSQIDSRNYYDTDVDRRGPSHEDPLTTTILLISKQVHSEARPVLYSENTFVLQLDSAVYTLTKLRQQSRSLIKHVSLTVPSHHHVLEGFADLVRLGLRYCWGLQTFTISLPTFLPRDREVGSNGTNVYANAFHILRWLPQSTKVVLDGGATHDIRQVVEENRRMANDLDNVSFSFLGFQIRMAWRSIG
jgi:hypothetical protein